MEQPRSHSTTTAASSPPPPPSVKVQPKKKLQVQESQNKLAPSPPPACSQSTSINTWSTRTMARQHHCTNAQEGNEMKMESNNGSKPQEVGVVQDEDTEMGGNDENMVLSRDSMMVKEYADGGSSIGVADGTITPHNSQFLNSDNENDHDPSSNLFKQFDAKTGQFLRHNRAPEGNANMGLQETNPNTLFMNSSNRRLGQQHQQLLGATPAASVANSTTLTPASSLRIYAKGKFRSHSVPTISHSSLRRLTNSNKTSHYHYHNINNHTSNSNNNNQHHANPISNHPLVSFGGIKKKKVLKSSHYHNNHSVIQANEGASAMLVDSQSTAKDKKNAQSGLTNLFPPKDAQKSGKSAAHSDKSSLRDALLLCHHVRPAIIKYHELSMEERINFIRNEALPVPMPPINLQCLKEIELQEIVKNPQLRHDIIFDPLLQFRPNLDGERGIKKRQLADKYWNDVENEIYVYSQRPDVFDYNHTRLVPLFNTLREVLLTIVPQREAHLLSNVLDTELNVQELLKGSLIMSSLSEWLAQLFKNHCAPMRDAWVDKMSSKFKEAEEESSLSKLIEGLRLVFQILEAMKLDIANHQIRILRTALLSNSVEFEKQYFQSLMSSNKVNLKSSLVWFNRKYEESEKTGQVIEGKTTARDIYRICINSVISLLSCRKMVREYPNSLSFDHARLILLRADIRQIVCLLVCRLLFRQLVANDSTLDKPTKDFVNASFTTKRLKEEIVSIITDEHGNCRWTKNIMSIAIHLCKTIQDLKNEYLGKESGTIERMSDPLVTTSLDTKKIDFARSWLSKQTQPLSEVYGVLENRVFKSLEDSIFNKSGCTMDGRVKQDFIYLCSNTTANSCNSTNASTTASSNNTSSSMTPPREGGTRSLMQLQSQGALSPAFNNGITSPNIGSSSTTISGSDSIFQGLEMEVFENVYRHLYTVVNFHWSVFGCHYLESLADKIDNSN